MALDARVRPDAGRARLTFRLPHDRPLDAAGCDGDSRARLDLRGSRDCVDSERLRRDLDAPLGAWGCDGRLDRRHGLRRRLHRRARQGGVCCGQQAEGIDIALRIVRPANAEVDVRLGIAFGPGGSDDIALEDGGAALDADRPQM
jgi:hypothetical protein